MARGRNTPDVGILRYHSTSPSPPPSPVRYVSTYHHHRHHRTSLWCISTPYITSLTTSTPGTNNGDISTVAGVTRIILPVMDMISNAVIDLYLTLLAVLFFPLGFSATSGASKNGAAAASGSEGGGIMLPVSKGGGDEVIKSCHGCGSYDTLMVKREASRLPAHIPGTCENPCQCLDQEAQIPCKAGVNKIQDGCHCCFMCARQEGDMCDFRAKCDEDKGLYCDHQIGHTGICKMRDGKSCTVNGRTYPDGQTFEKTCRELCTCQNGKYGCTTRCPQEEREPSRLHCNNPRLVAIQGQCCKEWVCSVNYKPVPVTERQTTPPPQEPNTCEPQSTPWSPCSVSCGIGVSIRFTNENKACRPEQEERLCMVRPCEPYDPNEDRRCKSAWRPDHAHKIHHDGCTSVQEHRLKFCGGACRRRKCCVSKAKTVNMQFQCGNESVVKAFEKIQECTCDNCR